MANKDDLPGDTQPVIKCRVVDVIDDEGAEKVLLSN